jgi:tRNA(Ile)-lysidine synthase TilS/MesJ
MHRGRIHVIAKQIFSWNSQEQCRRERLRRGRMRKKLKQWERLREEKQYLDSESIDVAS